MKNLALSLLFLSACFFTISAQEIKNGNFEDWKGAMPAGWACGYKTPNFIEKSKDAHSGKTSMRVVFTPQKKNDNRRFHGPDVDLNAGKYTVSLFLKGEGEIRYVTLTEKSGKPGSAPSETNIVGTPKIGAANNADWKQYDLQFTIPADGTYQLHIGINSGSEDTPFLLDDISIKKG